MMKKCDKDDEELARNISAVEHSSDYVDQDKTRWNGEEIPTRRLRCRLSDACSAPSSSRGVRASKIDIIRGHQ